MNLFNIKVSDNSNEALLFKLLESMESSNYWDAEIYANRLLSIQDLNPELLNLVNQVLSEAIKLKSFQKKKNNLIEEIVNFK